MPYRKQQFVNGEIYHIIVRRIEDNLLFKNIDDYYRGIFSIYEFNDTKPVIIRDRRECRDPLSANCRERVSDTPRESLVDTLLFCLMPNHLHLLLKQLKEGGISKFMNKFGAGYPAYFKKKHNLQRRGHFFQDRFVAVHIKTEEQLKVVFVYIHTNPISLIEPKWKEIGIKDPEKAIEFVENYKWSSYSDYIGRKNFPSVTNRRFLLDVMDDIQGCKDSIEDWVRYKGKGKIKEFINLALE